MENTAVRNQWLIRDFGAGDETGMNDLFNSVFNLKRPMGHWVWKFNENPLAPNKYICLAEKNGEIMAMYPCLPSYFKYFEQRCVVLQAVDNCVRADVRKGLKREGIFLKVLRGLIQQAIRKGCAFGFGFPTDEHFRYGEKKLGYINVGKLPILQKTVPETENRRSFIRKTLWHGIKARLPGAREGLFTVEEVRTFSEAFDGFWEKTAPDYQIIMERNARFLNWRYIINPTGTYKCLAVYEKERHLPCGYVVGQVQDRNPRTGLIFDFLLNGPEKAGKLLLARLEDHFRSAGVRRMECRMFEHVPMYDVLLASGFEKRPEAINVNAFIFDKAKIDGNELGKKENWHLTFGDSDTE